MHEYRQCMAADITAGHSKHLARVLHTMMHQTVKIA